MKEFSAKKKTIFCIEDDSTLLAVYAISFSPEQYNLGLFTSGEVAMKCMESVLPDIIFLDLNLPGLDGFGLLEQVERRFPGVEVPVVIVTGQSDTISVTRARQFHVAAFFAKPLTPDRIADFVESFFAMKDGGSLVVTKALLDCLKRHEEISLLDFERFLKVESVDHQKNYFGHLSKRGLVVDLGALGVDAVSDVANYVALQQIYKNGREFRKVKIFTPDDRVLRFLRNLGKFLSADLFISRNAAIRNIRIDAEFGTEV